ncbi:MAG: hypothetical protein M0P07_03775 [Candidatus Methanomethylophilaceae archaeon]|nr:hypothetical protein [Candidatus Methanomethylophilaceae archaeon]
MYLKNKKGITAIVDAMIFIIIISLAVAALYANTGDEEFIMNDASDVSNQLLSSDFRISDLMNTNDSSVVSLTDLLAAAVVTGDSSITDYIVTVLDALTERPDSYLLNLKYSGKVISLGTGDGNPVSGYITNSTVTFGGTLTFELYLY